MVPYPIAIISPLSLSELVLTWLSSKQAHGPPTLRAIYGLIIKERIAIIWQRRDSGVLTVVRRPPSSC